MYGVARQAHGEDRAAGLARHRHVAAHHARELARDGKAEAGSAEALHGRGIGLREFREQLVRILRRLAMSARPVVDRYLESEGQFHQLRLREGQVPNRNKRTARSARRR